MKYNLFLDDMRIPEAVFKYIGDDRYINNDWVIVRSYNEFTKHIRKHGIPETISFDHDLADIHYLSQFGISDTFYDE